MQTPTRIAWDAADCRTPDAARAGMAWWGVVALFLVHGLVVSTWVSRIAAVKSGLGLRDGSFGLALFGSAVGAVSAIPLSGWAIRRYGSKKTFLWTGTGFCVSLVLLAFASNLFSLSVALIAYGAMTGANDVAINAQAVSIEKLLGKPSMSRFHAMFSLGGIFGAVAGGFVAAQGIVPAIHFVVAASLILIGIVFTAPLILDVRERTGEETGSGPKRAGFVRPPAVLVALSIIGFCIFLSEGAIADWTAIYIRQVLNAGEGIAAGGYAAFSAAMTVFRFSGDALTARMGPAWVIRMGGLVAAGGLTLVVSADSAFTAIAGFALTGAGFSSIIPVVFAAGGRISSVGESAGIAMVSGIGYLGFLVGPPMIGFVSEIFSLRVALSLLVVLSAAAALLVTVVQRGHNSPLAETRSNDIG